MVSTELIGKKKKKKRERKGEEGRDKRGLGENEETVMEKEEKITNVIWPAAAVIISHCS